MGDKGIGERQRIKEEINAVLRHLTDSKVSRIIGLAEQAPSREGGFLHIPSKKAKELIEEILSEPDMKRIALLEEIEALSHNERVELMALMWIGRDFQGTFSQALRVAQNRSSEGDVGYIAEKAIYLPQSLRNGLRRIGLL